MQISGPEVLKSLLKCFELTFFTIFFFDGVVTTCIFDGKLFRELATFPTLPNLVSVENDATLAKSATAVGYAYRNCGLEQRLLALLR